ncbi:MAG: L-threonylcarbamoyladenylate synthase [Patescibacteria group bacterium]|nr:L-threonylcarbamoyladenylate synthase [Patescibacteria group bacterium]
MFDSDTEQIIKKAVETFKNGGVIVFPTDTIHGLGCTLNNKKAIERVYQIKGRYQQPSPVLVGSLNQAKDIAYLNKIARKLISRFWPGGLTVVVPTRVNRVPELIKGSNETVGLRMPNFHLLLKIINLLEEPILGTSANVAGQPPAISQETLDERLANLVDYIVPGKSLGKKPSTIVDLTQKPAQVIREGAIPGEKISALLQS